MPFLSKLLLNPLRSGTQRLLRDPQAVHASVLGGTPPGVRGRVLWREEVSRDPGAPPTCHLLVLTKERPDWSHMVERYGWATDAGAPMIRDLQPLLDMVVAGREFGFRARVNPVASSVHPEWPTESQRRSLAANPRRGVRLAHRTVEHQLTWFLQRTSGDRPTWGFSVVEGPLPQVTIAAREHVSFWKGQEERHRVTLDRVTFEGRLRVVDATRVREVLVEGLGRAKAYGCGLLTLAPVATDVVAG